MEYDGFHLFANWFDRAVDSHNGDMSYMLRRTLAVGQLLTSMAMQHSHWFL